MAFPLAGASLLKCVQMDYRCIHQYSGAVLSGRYFSLQQSNTFVSRGAPPLFKERIAATERRRSARGTGVNLGELYSKFLHGKEITWGFYILDAPASGKSVSAVYGTNVYEAPQNKQMELPDIGNQEKLMFTLHEASTPKKIAFVDPLVIRNGRHDLLTGISWGITAIFNVVGHVASASLALVDEATHHVASSISRIVADGIRATATTIGNMVTTIVSAIAGRERSSLFSAGEASLSHMTDQSTSQTARTLPIESSVTKETHPRRAKMPLVLGHNWKNRRSTVDFYTDTCPAPEEEELVCDDVQESRPKRDGAEAGELVPAELTRLDQEGAGAGKPAQTEVRVKTAIDKKSRQNPPLSATTPDDDLFFAHGVEPTCPRLDRESAGAEEPVPREVKVKTAVEDNSRQNCGASAATPGGDMFFAHRVESEVATMLEVVDEARHGVDHDTYSISPNPDHLSSADKGDEKHNGLTSFQVGCGVFLVCGVFMLIATSGAWVRNQETDDLYETLTLVNAYHEAGSEVQRRQQAKERLNAFMESMSEARREALHAALDEVSRQANINLRALLLQANTSARSAPDTDSIDEGGGDGQGGEGGFVDIVQETKLGGDDDDDDEHDDAANDYANGGGSGSLRSVSPAKGGTIEVGRGRVAKLKAMFESGAAATAPSSPAEEMVARKQSRSTFSRDKG